MKKNIDINVDLGEGSGFDELLMPLVSSCNIACGGHYGDDLTMRETIELAKKHKVKIGAHPSYPDLENFGRKVMKIPLAELKQSIQEQLISFFKMARQLKVKVHHIKLHGALYNEAALNTKVAQTVILAIDELQLNCALYVPFGSALHEVAKGSYKLYFEGFIDRTYNSDLSLVPRSNPQALIGSKEEAWNQLEQMILFGNVTAIDDATVAINAETFCIHGDTLGAVEFLMFIREKMEEQGITL